MTNSGLPEIYINAFAASNVYLFAASYEGGVFLSTNNGTNWVSINTGSADLSVNAIVISGENLFAETYNGVWRRNISDILVVEVENPIPEKYSLHQNYPNPFNPTTTIECELPKSTHIKIIVFDVLGREVQTLVNEQKPVGGYKVEFSADGLSSGIYFYQLQTNEFTQTKKLVVMK